MDNQQHPRALQLAAMATAEAWVLVTHACAKHHDHPHDPSPDQMSNAVIEGLEESGGIKHVIGALGMLLDYALGHQEAMDVLTAHYQSGGQLSASAFAELVAQAIGYDGRQAMDASKAADERARFYGTVADGLKPPQDEPPA